MQPGDAPLDYNRALGIANRDPATMHAQYGRDLGKQFLGLYNNRPSYMGALKQDPFVNTTRDIYGSGGGAAAAAPTQQAVAPAAIYSQQNSMGAFLGPGGTGLVQSNAPVSAIADGPLKGYPQWAGEWFKANPDAYMMPVDTGAENSGSRLVPAISMYPAETIGNYIAAMEAKRFWNNHGQ
jgi:hypothetical protein